MSVPSCLSSPGLLLVVVFAPESFQLLTGVPSAGSTQPLHVFFKDYWYINHKEWMKGFAFSLFQMDTQILKPSAVSGQAVHFPPSTPCPANTEVADFHVTAQSHSCQASLYFVMSPALFL